MHTLTIWQDGVCRKVDFHEPALVQTLLTQAGCPVEQPCGGRGVCGKCAVTIKGRVSAPNAAEKKAGTRLSCQAIMEGDGEVWLPDTQKNDIQLAGKESWQADAGEGYGAAVDIGTTTLALKLYDLSQGNCIASVAAMNPQRGVAADVMGRIGAALEGQGELLQQQIHDAVQDLLTKACRQAGLPQEAVERLVITGNTTMLYLLTGRSPEPLSHAPFLADCLFDMDTTLWNRQVYLPPCMNAFVGADITCAVLASGMTRQPDTALLCDIGTNGELALWKDGRLFVTSTAAGPAFEGAGISCGCGSVPGAIDRVWVEDGSVQAHTLQEQPAVGVCGSGLIDAIAAFLLTEDIDETGACEEDSLPLRDGIALLPKDVRAVQLAKAAIAAGIQTLLDSAGVSPEEVSRLYIAGGFGSHLNVASAAAIGLIPPELASRVEIIGNAALSGAAAMLMGRPYQEEGRKIAALSAHVNLGGNPKFNGNYIEHMLFECVQETQL